MLKEVPMNVSDATELEHAISTARWAVEKAISIVSCGPYGNRVDEPQFVTLDIARRHSDREMA
jgi:tRNA A37 threonylcarbamoyladenosine dehydratase